jgi:endo-alpha-1,4-polygalactosaminidase (GH114 family)
MRRLSLVVLVGVLVGVGLAGPARADDWWKPGADVGHLHWNLGGTINVDNPRHVGERSISGAVLPRPAVLDIDGEFNTSATVATLHGRGQRVICYIDAGVYEDYRGDAWRFPAEVIGKPDGNWDGSWWLDIRRLDVLLPIMEARIAMCQAKGFDAVEPDEIDGWENNTGFPLTYQHQLVYNRAIADLIHSYGMAAIQKGDIIQTGDLVDWFDAALVEECARYRECTNPWNPDTGQEQIGSQAYTAQGKPVWLAEYRNTDYTRMCRYARDNGWWAAQYKLGLPLGGGRKPC